MYLAELFERCGKVAHVDAGFYPVDWHLHHTEEWFIAWVESTGAREVDRMGLGDIAVFRFGRAFSHGAVCIGEDGLVMHSYIGRGVIRTRLTEEPLAGRTARFFTLFD